MKIFTVVSLLFFLTHALYSHTSVIFKLKAEDLPRLTSGLWVVHFYNQKQAHQQHQEDFKKAAFSLEGIVKVAAIDASQEKTDVDPSSCPLVRLYFNGEIINYNQPIKVQQLVSFIKFQLSKIINNKLQSVSGIKGTIKPVTNRQKGVIKTDGGKKTLKKGIVKVQSNFKTAQEIANPVQTQMSVIADQVISQK